MGKKASQVINGGGGGGGGGGGAGGGGGKAAAAGTLLALGADTLLLMGNEILGSKSSSSIRFGSLSEVGVSMRGEAVPKSAFQ